MNRTATTIRQIEFELEKAEHGMGLPYDAGRVGLLRGMLREARRPERVGAKFAAGTLDRIAVPLADGEKEPPSFAKRSSASSSAGKRPRQKPFRRSEARLCGPVTSDENIIIGGDSRTLPR